MSDYGITIVCITVVLVACIWKEYGFDLVLKDREEKK